MTIQLSPRSKRELVGIRKYGYSSPRAFVEDAIRHRVFELQKEDYFSKAKKIRGTMKRKGILEKQILEDFEETRHQ